MICSYSARDSSAELPLSTYTVSSVSTRTNSACPVLTHTLHRPIPLSWNVPSRSVPIADPATLLPPGSPVSSSADSTSSSGMVYTRARWSAVTASSVQATRMGVNSSATIQPHRAGIDSRHSAAKIIIALPAGRARFSVLPMPMRWFTTLCVSLGL